MNGRPGFKLLWVFAVLLVGAIILQSLERPPALANSSMARGVKLAAALPARLGEGIARDEAVAATEEMKKAVSELLNYDDAVFRIYEVDGKRISVYAAWWRPGRMSPRLVAAHTPDVCWPGNGWERDRNAEGNLGVFESVLAQDNFAPAEARVFRMSGHPEYVAFWHKVGDVMLGYHTGYAPPWWAWLDEMRRDGLNLRKEQLFVRVSSDTPLQDVWARPDLEPLRSALLALGLRAKGEGQRAKRTE